MIQKTLLIHSRSPALCPSPQDEENPAVRVLVDQIAVRDSHDDILSRPGQIPNPEYDLSSAAKYGSDFLEFMELHSRMHSLCKSGAKFRPVFDRETSHHVGFDRRHGEPIICGSPLCPKCAGDRKKRLMYRHGFFLDDRVYRSQYLRHIIATSPVIPSSQFNSEFVDLCLKRVGDFHMRYRKEHYAFRGFVGMEFHYQEETDSVYFHAHYGITCHVDIRRFRELWCKAWNHDLVVKYPIDEKTGIPRYSTNKLSYLEYVCRRRIEQPFEFQPQVYFSALYGRQLLRRIGFSKCYLARVTKIRKSDSCLPDGYVCIPLMISSDCYLRLTRFEEFFRRRYRDLLKSDPKSAIRTRCYSAVVSATEDIRLENVGENY